MDFFIVFGTTSQDILMQVDQEVVPKTMEKDAKSMFFEY